MKLVLSAIAGIIISLTAFHSVLLVSTNEVLVEARALMESKTNIYDPDEPLTTYSSISSWQSDAEVNINISRVLVLHDFSKGYMWVVYAYSIEEVSGEFPGHDAINDLVRWDIEMVQGHWKVVDIYVHP
jgi:hypothetical protein